MKTSVAVGVEESTLPYPLTCRLTSWGGMGDGSSRGKLSYEETRSRKSGHFTSCGVSLLFHYTHSSSHFTGRSSLVS